MRKTTFFVCALALCFAGMALAEADYGEIREPGRGYTQAQPDGKGSGSDATGDQPCPSEHDISDLDEGGTPYVRAEGTESEGDFARTPNFDPQIYDDVGPFVKGAAVVRDGNGYGLVDVDGAALLPVQNEDVELWEDGRGYCRRGALMMRFQLRDGALRFCHVHENGDAELLPAWAADWSRVVPLNCAPKRYLAAAGRRHCSWSLLDADGAVIEDGCLRAVPDFETTTEDADGRICPRGFTDGLVLAREKDGRYGFAMDTGEWLAHKFQSARDFSENLAVVETKKGWGFIDRQGNYVVKPKYAWAADFNHGYAVVAKGTYRDDLSGNGDLVPEELGLIDRTGAVALPLKYESIDYVAGGRTVRTELEDEEHYLVLTEDGVREVASVGSDLLLEDYMPFAGGKVAKLDGEAAPALRFVESAPLPRLDGATALFPVYAAFVEAVYPEDTRYEYADAADAPLVTCTKTNRAYERLIAGEADVIFCAGPSDAQLAMAEDAGVEFELTPFGREAFVFIVNADNPLKDISTEEIRGVYSGAITDWDALGVEGLGEIIAYQRPKNSGSQTALEDLMGDVPIMDAQRERVADAMDDILYSVEEYRNLPSALGYSFRFFCKEMMGSEVKLLPVDGVASTVENIRGGGYPLTTALYAVTRAGEENPNVKALLEWIVSEEGQELVEKSGYVGVAAR